MPDIVITRPHALPVERARAAAQAAADALAQEYQLSSSWQGDTLVFRRSGIEGSIAVAADRIRLEVSLGLLLKGFRGAIEQGIHRRLDQVLAVA